MLIIFFIILIILFILWTMLKCASIYDEAEAKQLKNLKK